MPSGPKASELLALRMASYTIFRAKSIFVEVYWRLLAGKEITFEDEAANIVQK